MAADATTGWSGDPARPARGAPAVGRLLAALTLAALVGAHAARGAGRGPGPASPVVDRAGTAPHTVPPAASEPAALEAAYRRAQASRRWESMVAVGDGYARLAATGGADRWRSRARAAYLAAFVWARRDRSAAGVLRAAEGFARLGDDAAARLALEAGRRLAGARYRSPKRRRVSV